MLLVYGKVFWQIPLSCGPVIILKYTEESVFDPLRHAIHKKSAAFLRRDANSAS